jgi:predicted aminopeptidase
LIDCGDVIAARQLLVHRRVRSVGRRRRRAVLVAAAAWLWLGGCFHAEYIAQAGLGQLDLYAKRRPISEVLDDPTTDARTRALLVEVGHVLSFAESHGLSPKGNYEHYVDLQRDAVVWFVTASRELSFEPKVWRFPIVGGFPYLGWFDRRDAWRFRDRLERDGWDVLVRPVRAYSTGGWFTDPVLSTMLTPRESARRSLVNVLLHELVHANVLVNDQSIFNESVATFVGDRMTEDYLAERFGAESTELAAYRAELAASAAYGARLSRAYRELAEVYESDRSEAAKRADKARILAALAADVPRLHRPNNALLLGYRTYHAGQAEFAALFEACGKSWPRFLAVVEAVRPGDFSEAQQEDIGPVILERRSACVTASPQARLASGSR